MITNNRENRENVMPLWEQYALTIEEAAIYFRIGENKLREIAAADPTQVFLLWNGNRCLIKRRLFEEYLDTTPSV